MGYLERDKAARVRDPIQALQMLGFELSSSNDLDAVDNKLAAFKASIDELAKAHDKLRSAWAQKGTDPGAADLKKVAGLIVDILQNVDAFRNAKKGE
jgi:hypothetical protein